MRVRVCMCVRMRACACVCVVRAYVCMYSCVCACDSDIMFKFIHRLHVLWFSKFQRIFLFLLGKGSVFLFIAPHWSLGPSNYYWMVVRNSRI